MNVQYKRLTEFHWIQLKLMDHCVELKSYFYLFYLFLSRGLESSGLISYTYIT